jgi:ariadne-1
VRGFGERKGLETSSSLNTAQIARLAAAAPVPAVTTPPITRKRKALEAALHQGDDARPAASNSLLVTPVEGRPLSKIRKTGKSQDSSSSLTSTSTLDAKFPVSLRKRGLDITTPTTTTGTMDSDDDLTDASSQEDFLGTQGSDDESLGDGKFDLPGPGTAADREKSSG